MKKALKLSMVLLLVLSLSACDWPWEDDDDDVSTTSGTAAGTTTTTGDTSTTEPKTEPATEPAPKPASGSENGRYHGLTNGGRPTWYFSKRMSSYPSPLSISVPGCWSKTFTNNGNRYQEGSWVVKQSHVAGRGMGLIGPTSCGAKSATAKW